MNSAQFSLAIFTSILLCVTHVLPLLKISALKLFLHFWPFLLRKNKEGIQIGEIRLTDQERIRHTHIVGATGTGKTVLMESLILEDIKRGRGAFIIDPKGDREFL